MALYYTTIDSPIGRVLLVRDDDKLIRVHFCSTQEAIEVQIPAGAVESTEGFGELIERLRLYFKGKQVGFSEVPIRFDGLGRFEEKVLRETMKIQYGRLMSYGSLAAAAGSPGAARAVGNAMRKNPLLIVVPCHRVVHNDGSMGGCSTGVSIRKQLLALEGVVI